MSSISNASQGTTYLNWEDRPKDTKEIIESAFNGIQNKHGWSMNGKEKYDLCNIDEHALMSEIILANPNQKEFYALDIGAGDFQWGEALKEYLNQRNDLPKDIKVNIIGIRGERLPKNLVIKENNRCKIYRLGGFKIEELSEQFKQHGLEIEGKVDLAVSRWTFRHLVDPVGTFAQTYNLLRPQSGYLLMDGFFFLRENQEVEKFYFGDKVANSNVTQLFLDTHAPFLTRFFTDPYKSLNHFILKRPDHKPCQLPLSYHFKPEYILSTQLTIYSGTISRFIRTQPEVECQLPDGTPQTHLGDQNLFFSLQQKQLIDHNQQLKSLDFPPLHQAVFNKDRHQLEAALKDSQNIYEVDYLGRTALHLAIEKGNYELFELLMNLYPKLDFAIPLGGKSPLAYAAEFDQEGRFIKALLEAGASANTLAEGRLPISFAIQARNLKAIEILLTEHSEIPYYDLNRLRDQHFASIHHLIPSVNNLLNSAHF